MLQVLGYELYDTEDIIGKCLQCGGDEYDAPQLATLMDLPAEQVQRIEEGVVKIGYCPECGLVQVHVTPV